MDGEIIKMVIEFIFLKCKITAYSDYNHKIKRCLLLGRKAMEIPGSILKQRYYLADKGSSSQSYSFPSSHVGCESWTIKKVSAEECLPLDCGFGEELLRVPFTVGRSNQSILKEINPQYSLEGLMLKLKLQYFGHTWWEELTQWKRPWCWERLRAGGKGDDRGWDGWMASLT